MPFRRELHGNLAGWGGVSITGEKGNMKEGKKAHPAAGGLHSQNRGKKKGFWGERRLGEGGLLKPCDRKKGVR